MSAATKHFEVVRVRVNKAKPLATVHRYLALMSHQSYGIISIWHYWTGELYGVTNFRLDGNGYCFDFIRECEPRE